MVEIGGRYFDPRFFQFGLTALVLKFIVYYIQSHLNPTMSLSAPDVVTIKNGNSSASVHLFGKFVCIIFIQNNDNHFVFTF